MTPLRDFNLSPRLAAELAAIARSTPMDGPGIPRGDLDDWIEGRLPRKPLTQADLDALPRDRRERDGEAFDIPIRFGGGLIWGESERRPRDRAEIVGEVIGACFVIGIALFLAWIAARSIGGARWT